MHKKRLLKVNSTEFTEENHLKNSDISLFLNKSIYVCHDFCYTYLKKGEKRNERIQLGNHRTR